MAILAGIVDAAASHPDRDNVERRVIMDATRLGIYFHSLDIRFLQLHIPNLSLLSATRSIFPTRKM
jgi:hypothetical protein